MTRKEKRKQKLKEWREWVMFLITVSQLVLGIINTFKE